MSARDALRITGARTKAAADERHAANRAAKAARRTHRWESK